ncbi:OmpA family protein [Marinicella sp. S1101]|uniref:OmpA family protein n=1 Tax=Marinicella marina TaxID=2996016 RepID=UPI002260FB77|nr:OmpA family protein [Marinicella marina]MCX7553676.1 OmpA family protein [Marinicella marina]MDJ1140766.1 OmpA family protein [Marinicella marina]
MKKTLLGLALSCVAGAALAAEYDDRWMLSPMVNFNATDSEKNLESNFGLGLGLGKFINDKWSVDVEYDQVSLDLDASPGSVSQTGLGLVTRYHFNEGSSMRPFLSAGIGWLDHDGSGSAAAQAIDSSDMMLNLGLGVRKMVTDRVGFMSEVKYRLDTDDYTGTASSYDDYVFSMGLNIALGAAAKAAAAPEIVEPAPQLDSDGDGVSDQTDRCPNTPAGMAVDAYGCHDGDADNDGVKDSMDKCPNSRAGAVVDADGCEVQVVIELQGVYFDLDKATLKDESIAILDAAVATMGEHGSIVVEVAGHTDSTASEAYNQDLSERRAQVVYNYLVEQGVSADRMTWKGYGESSPIATNDTAEGRAKNRRTELVIQD